MATKKKANPAVEARLRYRPQDQYEWRGYRRPGASVDEPALEVRMRAQLTNREVATLVFGDKSLTAEVWAYIAPFVTDWNLDDEDGNPVSPPSEAGGGQFNLINNTIFWEIFNDLKFRSGTGVTSDFLLKSKPSDASEVSSSDA